MKRIKILLAEDDLDDQSIFQLFLKDRQDIDVLPFVENGEEVFSYLNSITDSSGLPDCIILDHNMPKMSGKQTLELLKKNNAYAHIPVVIYSTYADNRLKDVCMTIGAAIVMSKPATQQGYDALIDECLMTVNSSVL